MKAGTGMAVSLGLVVVVCAVSSGAAVAQEVRNSSYDAPDGTRVLQQSIVVPATARDVWDAFTTTEGVQRWAVPLAHVDFRLGGIWESSYDREGKIGDPGNIRNRFLSFLPLRMLSFQAIAAPRGFPHAELLPDIFTVAAFDELTTGNVRVTLSMVGFKAGEGYDDLYRFFEKGNAWSLQQLHKHLSDAR